MAGQQVQPGAIGFIGHFAYYIMYRPSHAARRPFVECYSRYRTGDRSNRHRYCHFIQTAEKTIHPDGTTFFSNLSARELENERKAPINQRFANHLLERDLHLADFEVKQNSPSMGKTLKELNFRQKCNVNIVTIIRGEQRINIPGGEERLYPFDKLVVVGADVDLEHFRQYLVERYKKAQTDKEQTTHEVNMEQFTIAEGSHLIGRTILESGIRDRSACLVIGIERGSSSIKTHLLQLFLKRGILYGLLENMKKSFS